ncbi:unnamed protein product [Heligmosomoides polygyrus]|uniref:Sulfatase domain-containing protein n=1 Tax=Heligmosomoides polygyrus TaxID=6339 RepID=A0A183F9A2_HELPZ|nr:unnamed protein product [Heligmosomoides polygyrus]
MGNPGTKFGAEDSQVWDMGHSRPMDVHAYQLGLLDNIRQCLGSRWPLIFISPFIPSHLPSDGMSFVTREIKEYNNPKYL